MKFKLSDRQKGWIATIMIIVILSFLLYGVFFHGSDIVRSLRYLMRSMMSLVCGVAIAYILSPVLSFIERKIMIPVFSRAGIDVKSPSSGKNKRRVRMVSVALTILFFLIILYGLIRSVLPQVFFSIQSIINNLPVYFRNVSRFFNRLLEENPDMRATVNEILKSLRQNTETFVSQNITPRLTSLIQQISKRAVTLAGGIVNFLIGIIVAVYILNARERLAAQGKKLAYAFLPQKAANEVIGEFRFIHQTFTSFLVGKIIDSAIVAVLCFIGAKLLKTPFPMLVTLIIGVTNMIPFFGPYIGEVITGLIVFMVNPLSALYFLIFVILLQQLDGNIIGPRILGQSTGLSSIGVIFSILFFGAILGPVGWFIGVPLFAVIHALIRRFSGYLLRERGLPSDIGVYENTAYIDEKGIHKLDDPESEGYFLKKPVSALRKIFVREKQGPGAAANAEEIQDKNPAQETDGNRDENSGKDI